MIMWKLWVTLPAKRGYRQNSLNSESFEISDTLYHTGLQLYVSKQLNQSMSIALNEIKFVQKHFCLSHMKSISSCYVAILHVLQLYIYMNMYIYITIFFFKWNSHKNLLTYTFMWHLFLVNFTWKISLTIYVWHNCQSNDIVWYML